MDNPQAFPISYKLTPAFNKKRPEFYMGMTLRDYFANTAMLGILRDKDRVEPINLKGSLDKPAAEIISEDAYFLADAMLKERNKDAV